MPGWRLVADVGGTNVRFARAGRDRRMVSGGTYRVARFADFPGALEAYLDETGGGSGCAGAAIAAAGPVLGDSVTLTNSPWRIERQTVLGILGEVPLLLVNDLQAVALALPHLPTSAVAALGPDIAEPSPASTRLVVNVGTGFGAAALLASRHGPLSVPSEAGHMTLPATDGDEVALLSRADPPMRSVEDALSGAGLVRLYRCLGPGDGRTPHGAGDVFARARDDPAAREALRRFTILLARVAGDLVLSHAAWGGVWLCGSVARNWLALCDQALFRKILTEKGKMSDTMSAVPSSCILDDQAALTGLAHAPLPG